MLIYASTIYLCMLPLYTHVCFHYILIYVSIMYLYMLPLYTYICFHYILIYASTIYLCMLPLYTYIYLFIFVQFYTLSVLLPRALLFAGNLKGCGALAPLRFLHWHYLCAKEFFVPLKFCSATMYYNFE